MRSTILHLVLVFSLAFNIAFAGIWVYHRSQPRPPALGVRPGSDAGGPQRGWGQLDLPPEKERQIRESWEQVEGRLHEIRFELDEHRDTLFALLASDPPDDAAIAEVNKSIETLEEERRRIVMGQMMATRELLTPEQRTKWADSMRSHGDRLGSRRWRNGHSRRGDGRRGDGRPEGRRSRRGPGGGRRPMGRRPGPGMAPPPEGEGLPPGPPPTSD